MKHFTKMLFAISMIAFMACTEEEVQPTISDITEIESMAGTPQTESLMMTDHPEGSAQDLSEVMQPLSTTGSFFPTGSYQLTCQNISITLSAKARDINGIYQPNSFDLTHLSTPDLWNDNGVIKAAGGTAPQNGFIPGGSWILSSQDIQVTVNCQAQKIDGTWVNASFDLTNRQTAELWNDDGVLRQAGQQYEVQAYANSASGGQGLYAGSYQIGDVLQFTAATTDTWDLASNGTQALILNADGSNTTTTTLNGQNYKTGAMLGSFDNGASYFFIGTSSQITVNSTADLKLYCSDSNFNDNSGSITLTIQEL